MKLIKVELKDLVLSKRQRSICLQDSYNNDPLLRVIPVELIKWEKYGYDKEKYREMLIEAAETVLGYFGFDRNAYGDHISKRNRDWRRALYVERQRDSDTERI
jgi:hypothetical protein